jgi:hypothetical protein
MRKRWVAGTKQFQLLAVLGSPSMMEFVFCKSVNYPTS